MQTAEAAELYLGGALACQVLGSCVRDMLILYLAKNGLSREPGLKSSMELLLLCFPILSFSAPLSACPTACPAALPSRVR